MASPVRSAQHGEPDNLIQTWLGTYAATRPGIRAATNPTLQPGPDDTPQPPNQPASNDGPGGEGTGKHPAE